MATSTSVPVILLIAAAVLLLLPSSLACSHCPPTAPGSGSPTRPSPGSGSGSGSCGGGCRPPHHGKPPVPASSRTGPIDSLKLNACVDVLSGLIHVVIGQEAKSKCCPLVKGVADLDAALCLCTAIRLRLLNINILLPIALSLLVSCGKHPPSGFQCPAAQPALYD